MKKIIFTGKSNLELIIEVSAFEDRILISIADYENINHGIEFDFYEADELIDSIREFRDKIKPIKNG
jgi:hypothetical protein